MEFNLGNGISIHLSPLHITIIAIIIIVLLVRWSKQLETRRFTIFFYFLISAYIASIYSQTTKNGVFELWLPVGFIFISIYLDGNKKCHPAKVKASILGLSIALYQLIVHYI
ncbi:hypothetical protein KHA93_05505 [Bacillus sp. FJAT-49732]|uniref:Uncharacterized protein n=1 Tax=Lederbergia citrisecunda TaxID=2833583 RepID=A0A942YJ93_9BACI|nr:hypothetical protein [Lederbergia citrisecunda]MBS4199113.1 hypothetical protein [Lederbergia citrisecunda]